MDSIEHSCQGFVSYFPTVHNVSFYEKGCEIQTWCTMAANKTQFKTPSKKLLYLLLFLKGGLGLLGLWCLRDLNMIQGQNKICHIFRKFYLLNNSFTPMPSLSFSSFETLFLISLECFIERFGRDYRNGNKISIFTILT